MSKKMMTVKGTVVIRDGVRVRPKIGEVFDYTADEVKTINETTPGTLREPNTAESESSEPTKATSTRKTAAKSGAKTTTKKAPEGDAETAQSNARNGEKQSTANKSPSDNDGDDEL